MLKMNWREVRGTQQEKPAALDTDSSPSTIYIRKNIRRITETTESGSCKAWKYDEAALTKEEYAEYEQLIAELESPAIEKLREENANLAAALADLYETQQATQEAIMLGLADVYEATTAAAGE